MLQVSNGFFVDLIPCLLSLEIETFFSHAVVHLYPTGTVTAGTGPSHSVSYANGCVCICVYPFGACSSARGIFCSLISHMCLWSWHVVCVLEEERERATASLEPLTFERDRQRGHILVVNLWNPYPLQTVAVEHQRAHFKCSNSSRHIPL